jgi:hypothetical protein
VLHIKAVEENFQGKDISKNIERPTTKGFENN